MSCTLGLQNRTYFYNSKGKRVPASKAKVKTDCNVSKNLQIVLLQEQIQGLQVMLQEVQLSLPIKKFSGTKRSSTSSTKSKKEYRESLRGLSEMIYKLKQEQDQNAALRQRIEILEQDRAKLMDEMNDKSDSMPPLEPLTLPQKCIKCGVLERQLDKYSLELQEKSEQIQLAQKLIQTLQAETQQCIAKVENKEQLVAQLTSQIAVNQAQVQELMNKIQQEKEATLRVQQEKNKTIEQLAKFEELLSIERKKQIRLHELLKEEEIKRSDIEDKYRACQERYEMFRASVQKNIETLKQQITELFDDLEYAQNNVENFSTISNDYARWFEPQVMNQFVECIRSNQSVADCLINTYEASQYQPSYLPEEIEIQSRISVPPVVKQLERILKGVGTTQAFQRESLSSPLPSLSSSPLPALPALESQAEATSTPYIYTPPSFPTSPVITSTSNLPTLSPLNLSNIQESPLPELSL